jgi:hypothetical protein
MKDIYVNGMEFVGSDEDAQKLVSEVGNLMGDGGISQRLTLKDGREAWVYIPASAVIVTADRPSEHSFFA